jgi:hypothetical protein
VVRPSRLQVGRRSRAAVAHGLSVRSTSAYGVPGRGRRGLECPADARRQPHDIDGRRNALRPRGNAHFRSVSSTERLSCPTLACQHMVGRGDHLECVLGGSESRFEPYVGPTPGSRHAVTRTQVRFALVYVDDLRVGWRRHNDRVQRGEQPTVRISARMLRAQALAARGTGCTGQRHGKDSADDPPRAFRCDSQAGVFVHPRSFDHFDAHDLSLSRVR